MRQWRKLRKATTPKNTRNQRTTSFEISTWHFFFPIFVVAYSFSVPIHFWICVNFGVQVSAKLGVKRCSLVILFFLRMPRWFHPVAGALQFGSPLLHLAANSSIALGPGRFRSIHGRRGPDGDFRHRGGRTLITGRRDGAWLLGDRSPTFG